MSYRNKKDVIKSIVQRNRDGRILYDAYLGYDPITKKQRRIQGSDLKKLKEDIEAFYLTIHNNGDIAASLKPYEVLDARKAYDILYKHNIQRTLEEIVLSLVKVDALSEKQKTIGDVFDEYYNSFPDSQELHRRTIMSRVGKWVVAYGRSKPISSVDAKTITDWIGENYSGSNKTYNNVLTYIKSFFSWCISPERKYLKENPLGLVKKRAIAYKDPEFLSVEDTRKLFATLEKMKNEKPVYLAYAILSFFCGIRREEIKRMAEDDEAASVNLEDEMIRIIKVKRFTQGQPPRSFHIQPNALAWMKSFDFHKAVKQITDKTTQAIYKVGRENGIEIPKNAGRHSFITYHVAKFQNPAQTEAIAGTSRKMRTDNYCNIAASLKDGEDYFNIIPLLS